MSSGTLGKREISASSRVSASLYVDVASIAREDILLRERAFTAYVSAIPAARD
jgi:hypothetical protein